MLTHLRRTLHWLACLAYLLTSGHLSAQFAGGSGDGFFTGGVVQLTFDGLPAGVRAVYTGGAGDGFGTDHYTVTLSGASLSGLYSGGPADGFDHEPGTFSLTGMNLDAVFSGGGGDGFDRQTVHITLSGADIQVAFAGGDGDGFSRETAVGTLAGGTLASMFAGGDGDGFDHLTANFLLNGTLLLEIFVGGPGDGADHQTYSATVSGLNMAIVYGGGGGSGFHANYFFGVVPLPLTLVSFDAIPEEQYVLVKWVTEDEVGTDFFTIEKTVDGHAFSTVGTTPAAGTSAPGERLFYELHDNEPYSGTSFYRLQTTDFDGAISLSHLVEVRYAQSSDWTFTLFPNPNTGRHFSVQTSGIAAGGQLTIEVYDASGRQLFQQKYQHDEDRAQLIELSSRLVPGSYLIRASHGAEGQQAKILLVQ
ncbi:hypothetical protein GGR28_000896 [Lewinella aquimaris]|uniref:Secreted protein (Por secretion system target) n=1 Tax=Neolewinella aquimaris TaxID=1835722 RepID=A0A840E3Q1_9BACT|nr:T9SS type A sorting domain-containing protein [Neolewinella aquimaris]MBB4078295.1 hypothetical protein [Neolewinella aquimaris]